MQTNTRQSDKTLNTKINTTWNKAYGSFLTPNVEVGGVRTVAGAKDTRTLTTLGVFDDDYFRGNADAQNPLVPYVGVFAGYSHKDDSSASLGAQAGVKYLSNPNVALTGEYQCRSTPRGNGTNQVIPRLGENHSDHN